MTNHTPDMMNSKYILVIGANPATNHPVSMQHILRAKEKGMKLVVVDPRFSKTAAKAHEYLRIRAGTDIAFVYGVINVIIENELYDKEYVNDRVYGFEQIKEEAAKYPLAEVENITGIPAEAIKRVAFEMSKAKPASLIYNQGLTQHHIGSSNTRVVVILQTLLGNMGKSGGGVNVLRGHDNVQGASDMGNLADTLPGYYGVGKGAWEHYARVWKLPYEKVLSRFASEKMMTSRGFALSTWRFGVINNEHIKYNNNQRIRALIVMGNGISTTAMTDLTKEALDKLDLVVFFDPYLNDAAMITTRQNKLFCIPAASQMENEGSVTATNRSCQWREKIVEPLYECKLDHEVLFDFAKQLGFYDDFVKALGDGKGNFTWPDDATAEIANACRSIGWQGYSANRLRKHNKNWKYFSPHTLMGSGPVAGEYYGLPWPCWNEKHPGTPILYDISKPVMQGGMGFRARWGEEGPLGGSLMPTNAPKNSPIPHGYVEVTAENVEELTGIKLTPEQKELVKGTKWSTDNTNILVDAMLSRGLVPCGNGRARFIVPQFIDKWPKHREPLHTAREDLLPKYKTFKDQKNLFRIDARFISEQDKPWLKDFPLQLLTGRLVAHMGTGTETRSAKYLAELQGEMFAEIHPKTASKYGILDGEQIWLYGTNGGRIKTAAKVTYKVGEDTIFLPQNFSGQWEGKQNVYPFNTAPYAYGAIANAVVGYGYDVNTACPETKAGLVRIEKA